MTHFATTDWVTAGGNCLFLVEAQTASRCDSSGCGQWSPADTKPVFCDVSVADWPLRCAHSVELSTSHIYLALILISSCCHTQSKMRPFLFLFISTFLICWTGRIFHFLCSMLLSMTSIYVSIYHKYLKLQIYICHTQKVYCKLFRTQPMFCHGSTVVRSSRTLGSDHREKHRV